MSNIDFSSPCIIRIWEAIKSNFEKQGIGYSNKQLPRPETNEASLFHIRNNQIYYDETIDNKQETSYVMFDFFVSFFCVAYVTIYIYIYIYIIIYKPNIVELVTHATKERWDFTREDATNSCYFKKTAITLKFEDEENPEAPPEDWEASFYLKLPPRDGKWVWKQRVPVLSVGCFCVVCNIYVSYFSFK